MWLCKRDLSKECEGKYKNCVDCVLDKIKAEIMQLDYDLESVDYDYNDMTMTEEVHTICREEVLQIIDNEVNTNEDSD